MAIKIQTQDTFIPIELGDLTLKFHVTDESIINFRKEALKVQLEFEKFTKSEDDEEMMVQAKGALKRGLDIFFGDGAFEKVYDISPSIVITMNYFEQMVKGITSELNKMGLSESQAVKAKKYLAKNKK